MPERSIPARKRKCTECRYVGWETPNQAGIIRADMRNPVTSARERGAAMGEYPRPRPFRLSLLSFERGSKVEELA